MTLNSVSARDKPYFSQNKWGSLQESPSKLLHLLKEAHGSKDG